MNIEWIYSQDNIDWKELSDLYKIAPLGNKNLDDLEMAFSNSMFKCFLLDEVKLIGAGRALADGAVCSYVCDVAVLPSHQGLGIGKNIVSRLVELSSNHQKVILYSCPGKESFYKKLGFKGVNTAMAIFGNQSIAL